MLLVLHAALLSGCLPAVHQGQGVWKGTFALEAPALWEVTRNRRLLGHHELILRAPNRCCTIAVERLRETRSTRDLPLSLIADALPLQAGRIHGIVSEPIAHHQIELQGREAWATTLMRHNGPYSWMETAIYTRADGGLYVLTLDYPTNANASVVRAWERVLSSFDIPGATPPTAPPWEPEPFLDDPPSKPAPETL